MGNPCVLGYLRVSTDEQTESGLGMSAQAETIRKWVEYKNGTIEWVNEGTIPGAGPPPGSGRICPPLSDASTTRTTLLTR